MKPDASHAPSHPGRHGGPAKPPAVPLTLDGSSALHQMFRVRWPEWRAVAPDERESIVAEATSLLRTMESHPEGGSGIFAQLGHKGDLMLAHFRASFENINETELQLSSLRLWDYLEPTTSYVSVVELGQYAASVQLYKGLTEQGVEPGSEEWAAAEKEKMGELRQALHERLFPTMPGQRFLCFYPMDKKRGETKNWYAESMEDRGRMMRDHGMIGRRYAGRVKQIISGSIGFDDWEWGVDLFADDPRVFKQLVYEMRFDEASVWYGLFGAFYIGIRFPASELGTYLSGRKPTYGASA